MPLSEAQEGMTPRVPGLPRGVMPRIRLGKEWKEYVAWGAIHGDLGLPAFTTEGRVIALQQSCRLFEAITQANAGGGQHTWCGGCRCDPTVPGHLPRFRRLRRARSRTPTQRLESEQHESQPAANLWPTSNA